MTKRQWQVIVWDGFHWFRGPVIYDDEREARDAASRIKFARAEARSLDEIQAMGIPDWAPSPKH